MLPVESDVERKKRKRYSVAQVKGNWQSNDDEKLVRLVQEQGEGNWSLIAQSFPGRIGKQCRERWNNQLRPDIKRDAWTHAEEVLLVAAHKQVGNKWAEIAKDIPGRTENAVKNHWNATLRKSGKKPHSAAPGGLAHYMRSVNMQRSKAQHAKPNAFSSAGQHAGPSVASNSSNSASATCSDENADPACCEDVADSKGTNTVERNVAASLSIHSHQDSRAASDSDLSEEYVPSQHASRSSRYMARTGQQQANLACEPAPSACAADHSQAAQNARPRTISLQSSTNAPLVQARSCPEPSVGPPRLCGPRRIDPRLDMLMQQKFAEVTPAQAQKQLLLHSLQGRGSDRLTNAELADLDTFCLDSVLMGYDGIEVPSSAAAGAKVGESVVHQVQQQMATSHHSAKPLDPRLARFSTEAQAEQQPLRFMPAANVKHDSPAAVSNARLGQGVSRRAPQDINSQLSGNRLAERCEQMAESNHQCSYQQQLQSVPPVGGARSSCTATDDVAGQQLQSMAAGRSLATAPAPQLCVQSSDNIHIQFEPLDSMDSYAAKLMSPGIEVAIYSGRCPLAPLASAQPPRVLQQQVLTKLQRVCGWVRASSQYQVGSLLIAVRAGHVPPGLPGLVIAASAQDKSPALQAVQAAVKQVEALGAHTKDRWAL